jgi:hypothetical protein
VPPRCLGIWWQAVGIVVLGVVDGPAAYYCDLPAGWAAGLAGCLLDWLALGRPRQLAVWRLAVTLAAAIGRSSLGA